MREPVRDKSRLEHILTAILQVKVYIQGLTKEQLTSDLLHLHATVYNVQIIGEATYKLTKEFKESHPETPWSMIEKMRHILVHDYYQINKDVLWIVVTEDLPILETQVKSYLKEMV